MKINPIPKPIFAPILNPFFALLITLGELCAFDDVGPRVKSLPHPEQNLAVSDTCMLQLLQILELIVDLTNNHFHVCY
jgi:hypothetical protein